MIEPPAKELLECGKVDGLSALDRNSAMSCAFRGTIVDGIVVSDWP